MNTVPLARHAGLPGADGAQVTPLWVLEVVCARWVERSVPLGAWAKKLRDGHGGGAQNHGARGLSMTATKRIPTLQTALWGSPF